MKVLIIDDEPHVITVARLLVDWKAKGFHTVLSCGSAEEALEMVYQHEPELILSDINLPGLDGLDLIEKVRTLKIPSKVILITAYSDFSYAQRAIKLDCVDYLLKPLSEDSLNQAVDKAMKLYAEDRMKNTLPMMADPGRAGSENPIRDNYQNIRELCLSVKDYLLTHYTENISLDSLSDLFNISSSHLSRSYKKEIGIGLVDDLTGIRLGAACELLKKGKTTSEIAYLVGFADSKYFNRVFKKNYNCTPGEYRKQVNHE